MYVYNDVIIFIHFFVSIHHCYIIMHEDRVMHIFSNHEACACACGCDNMFEDYELHHVT